MCLYRLAKFIHDRNESLAYLAGHFLFDSFSVF